jgi:hypothetical protein
MVAGAEPQLSFIKTFRAMGLRGASDLVDATKDSAGKLRIVLAAQTIRGTVVEDPTSAAQLASLRAQLKVKEAQEKVSQVKGKKKGEGTEDIATALETVRSAKLLVDCAHKEVKDGGDKLKGALDAATELQATVKIAGKKADEVDSALKAVTDNKVSEQLENALKTLGEKMTADVNTQAQSLVSELDKIAQPLSETESKAKEFLSKAEAISKEAEKESHTQVPAVVAEAGELLTSLSTLAQAAKQRIETDTILSDAEDEVTALVKLLSDDGEDEPKKLLSDERLKKAEQWTSSDNKTKVRADAQKLVELAKEVLELIASGITAITKARAAATVTTGTPALTMEILECMLLGLQYNSNLKRIHRYLLKTTQEVPS